mgnify:FL=1
MPIKRQDDELAKNVVVSKKETPTKVSVAKKPVRKTVKKVSKKKKTVKVSTTKKTVHFGRPLKFKSVKELQNAIDEYFKSLFEPAFDMWGNPVVNKKTGEQIFRKTSVATITGLAVALDTTRETLLDYENKKHDGKDRELTEVERAENEQIVDFSDTIKKAKLRIYADTEQQLYRGKPTGAIFSLKNNYGWVDKTVTEATPSEPINPFSGLTEDELRKLAGGAND